MKIMAGAVLVIEFGEYSDYGFNGPFKVLRSFDQGEVSEDFRRQWKKGPDDAGDLPYAKHFIDWMTKQGYIEPLQNAHVWNVGSYGFDPKNQ